MHCLFQSPWRCQWVSGLLHGLGPIEAVSVSWLWYHIGFIFFTAAYMCSLWFVFFFKEYEAIYLAKLTINMMSPMQLGRSFSLQAGVAGLCKSYLFNSPQLTGVCLIAKFSPLNPPRTLYHLILLRPFTFLFCFSSHNLIV